MWDERYSESEYFYGKEPNDFLKSQIHLIKPEQSVLCLAEGEGRNAVFIAASVAGTRVTAMDGSQQGLEKTRRLAHEKNTSVETVHADLSEFEFATNQWDVIISIWCHLPSTLRRTVHASVVRALKPGGLFILEAYTPAQLKYATGGPKSEDMLMTLSSLKEELHGLQFVHGVEMERTVLEGQGHTGHSAVVQVIAQKNHATEISR